MEAVCCNRLEKLQVHASDVWGVQQAALWTVSQLQGLVLLRLLMGRTFMWSTKPPPLFSAAMSASLRPILRTLSDSRAFCGYRVPFCLAALVYCTTHASQSRAAAAPEAECSSSADMASIFMFISRLLARPGQPFVHTTNRQALLWRVTEICEEPLHIDDC